MQERGCATHAELSLAVRRIGCDCKLVNCGWRLLVSTHAVACVCVRARACLRTCVRACVRACVRECLRARVSACMRA